MQNLLIKVNFNDLVGHEKLDCDLFNEKGEIIYKKGQKIDSGFLLMLRYINLYRDDDSALNRDCKDSDNEEIIEFARDLLLLAVKRQADEVHIVPVNDTLNVKFISNEEVKEEVEIDESFLIPLVTRLKRMAN